MASRQAEAHIVAQARLRRLAAGTAGRIWRGLPGYDRENVDQWLSQVLPVIATSQRASVALTNAYLRRYLGRATPAIPAERVIARTRPGVAAEEVYRRPFVTLWSALGSGKLFAEASEAALARASSTAAMDVQLASFGTYAEVERQDSEVRRWRRVADGGACEFCSMIDGAIVLSADASPLHNNCGCGLEPVEDEIEPTPIPEGVAVHEHSELGAVLGDPSHGFTTL